MGDPLYDNLVTAFKAVQDNPDYRPRTKVQLQVEGPERGELLDAAMQAGGPVGDYFTQAVGDLVARLDAELTLQLLALPPGTLVCMHSIETFMPVELWAARLTVRRRAHLITAPEACTVEGRREVYTSPWLCRGCGQRRTIVEGQACEVCLNRYRRETLLLPGSLGNPGA